MQNRDNVGQVVGQNFGQGSGQHTYLITDERTKWLIKIAGCFMNKKR